MSAPSLAALLGRGYLPHELPWGFTSRSLGLVVSSISLSKRDRKVWRSLSRHSLPQPGGTRRQLAIPHPAGQIMVAEALIGAWSSIEPKLLASPFTLSRPVQAVVGRSVRPATAYTDLSAVRARRRRSARYVAIADVSQYYRSVYTHAVPWALTSKAGVKTSLAAGIEIPGDKIDKALRNSQDGQTIGIPIGPDTSLIVSELLLSAVDEQVRSALPAVRAGNTYRFMDDYEFSCGSVGEAEDFLAELEAALFRFELALNKVKTRVEESPLPIEAPWRTELNHFDLRTTSRIAARNDIVSLMSRAFELQAAFQSEAVVKYALVKAVRSARANALDNWPLLVDLALASVRAEPSCIETLALTLVAATASGARGLRLGDVAEELNRFATENSRRARSYEVAWAMWSLCLIGAPLDAQAAKAIESVDDDVVAILLLHMVDIGLCVGGHLPNALAGVVADPDAANREHWLLAYEATRHGWQEVPAVRGDGVLSQMLALDVEFFEGSMVRAGIGLATARPAKPSTSVHTPGAGPPAPGGWMAQADLAFLGGVAGSKPVPPTDTSVPAPPPPDDLDWMPRPEPAAYM